MYCNYCNPYTQYAELSLAFLFSYDGSWEAVHLHNAFLHGRSRI